MCWWDLAAGFDRRRYNVSRVYSKARTSCSFHCTMTGWFENYTSFVLFCFVECKCLWVIFFLLLDLLTKVDHHENLGTWCIALKVSKAQKGYRRRNEFASQLKFATNRLNLVFMVRKRHMVKILISYPSLNLLSWVEMLLPLALALRIFIFANF